MAQYERVVDALAAKFPAAADHLDAAWDDLLAFTAFPREVWRRTTLRSNDDGHPVAFVLLVLTWAPDGGAGFCLSAASRGVELVFLALVDGVGPVTSAVGGGVAEGECDDDDDNDPQDVNGEADQPERVSAAVRTTSITWLRLVRWPSRREIRWVSRRPSGVWRPRRGGDRVDQWQELGVVCQGGRGMILRVVVVQQLTRGLSRAFSSGRGASRAVPVAHTGSRGASRAASGWPTR
jgi:hypothetical protein